LCPFDAVAHISPSHECLEVPNGISVVEKPVPLDVATRAKWLHEGKERWLTTLPGWPRSRRNKRKSSRPRCVPVRVGVPCPPPLHLLNSLAPSPLRPTSDPAFCVRSTPQYGGLKPKAKLMPKDHKFFDSADWAMQQQGKPTVPKAASGLRASKEVSPGGLQGKPGAPSGD